MLALAVTRCALVHLLRSPFCWVLLVATACLLPTLAVLSPLGLAHLAEHSPGHGLLASTAGCAMLTLLGSHSCCLAALHPLAPILAREGPRRLGAEALAFSITALLFCVPALFMAHLLGGGAVDNHGTSASFTVLSVVFLAHIHLMGPSLVILRLPLPAPLSIIGLLSLAWALPALLPGAPFLSSLAVGSFLLQAAHGPPAAVWSTAIHLPIFALWVGTLLLLAPPRPRPH